IFMISEKNSIEIVGIVQEILMRPQCTEAQLKIRINNEIYKVEIKTTKKMHEYLNGYRIKLKGIIDKTQKVIKNPSEIWLKLE
ncbi:MAG: hypothetical protein ACTSQG_12010, partial [Promethearchaeota archaeon]